VLEKVKFAPGSLVNLSSVSKTLNNDFLLDYYGVMIQSTIADTTLFVEKNLSFKTEFVSGNRFFIF
jgi:hypothetical protein